jgi:enoyl-CoA hydratase/carnithine racemase
MGKIPSLTDLDDDGIYTITFNRPEKKNTINLAMWLGLHEAFTTFFEKRKPGFKNLRQNQS